MQVRWSIPAAEDLEHNCEWIERDNPEAARRVAQTIYDECARLKDFPNLGRASSRMAGRRELTFAPWPYIVIYNVTPTRSRFRAFFTACKTGPESGVTGRAPSLARGTL